jgi:hypothetical protein
MRLGEHPDFAQAILRAAEYFQERGLRPALIEKDYYVTEALRVIANTVGDKVIFKGGTSLYEQQCRTLCYGPFPSWSRVQAKLNELRSLL